MLVIDMYKLIHRLAIVYSYNALAYIGNAETIYRAALTSIMKPRCDSGACGLMLR